MTSFQTILITIAFAINTNSAIADTCNASESAVASFAVAGVFQKNSTGAIRVFQSLVTAETESGAIVQFTDSVMKQQPGYTPLDAVTTPINPATPCTKKAGEISI